MFAKLLKHEWRATSGTQTGLCAAVVGLGAAGAIAVNTLIKRADSLNELANASLALSLFFIYLAIVICAAASAILLMVRYYKSRFTDQGYLTFTLPVTVHQNFLSALTNHLIWMVLMSVSVVVAFGMLLLAGYLSIGDEVMQNLKSTLTLLYGETFEVYGQTMLKLLPIYVVQIVINTIYGVVLAMTCLTVGATIAKKRKILAAIGIYYLIGMVSGMVQNIFTMSITIDMNDIAEGAAAQALEVLSNQLLMVTIPVQILMMAGCYFLSITMMKKKLNLT